MRQFARRQTTRGSSSLPRRQAARLVQNRFGYRVRSTFLSKPDSPFMTFIVDPPCEPKGMVPQDGIEPPLALYIRQPRCHCATGASIRSFRDRVELFPPAWVAEFFPTPVAEANLAFLIQLFPASFARHKLALGAGLEPARLLVNSQAPCQFGYPRTTWWAITDSNCALSIKSRVLRRQSL